MALDIVGIADIADRLVVRQQTAAAWNHRGLLPSPAGYVSGLPWWHWRTIERWAKATGRDVPTRRAAAETLTRALAKEA